MTIHDLKIHPGPFIAVVAGLKTHEVRTTADRSFREGDYLVMHEWLPVEERYTSRFVTVKVTHVTWGGDYGLPVDVCVMSIRMLTYSRPVSENELRSVRR